MGPTKDTFLEREMRIIVTLFATTTFGFVVEKPEASSFLRSRRESDCGSMPGAEEMCREESNSYDSGMDYSLSSDINDGDATSGTQDYEMYGLGGSDQNDFAADNSYDSLMNYDQ